MKTIAEPPGKAGLRPFSFELPAVSVHPQDEPSSVARFATTTAMVKALQPDHPVHCLRPHAIKTAAHWFLTHFPGDVLYAVKTNPDPRVLGYLYETGVRHFDVASVPEIALVRGLFADAQLYFMHPIKSRAAIETAYFTYGVRDFALDCFEELHKILEVTHGAEDLRLHIRMSLPKGTAAYDLSGKFGATPDQCVELLRLADKVASRVGLCFHVGSQCMDPQAYAVAMQKASDAVVQSGIVLDVLDVGGGFPSLYPGMTPPALSEYMAVIENARNLPGFEKARLYAEPGRALVAEGGSVMVRVELRKGDALYINDGIYGSLFDAGFTRWNFPTRAIRLGGKTSTTMREYSFFGPTCDSLDQMQGPFLLPEDMKEGDWIEIGQLGAYGATLQTRFNGFYSDTVVETQDAPLMSLFAKADARLENA
jgi:ornithine decarboxylase